MPSATVLLLFAPKMGVHRNMRNAITVPPFVDEWKGELPLFSLDGLLPLGQALSVNTDCLVVSLALTHSANGNPILLQRLLTELQMRLLLPLLESPHYCPHEVLYTSLFCSYRGLLARHFSSDSTAREEWLAAMQETRSLLERAQARGMWRKELKQIYNVLSELRAKLRPFGLGISISTSGSAYALISLPASEQEAHEPWRVPPWAANGSSQPSLSGAI
jgi:hypothetical protein